MDGSDQKPTNPKLKNLLKNQNVRSNHEEQLLPESLNMFSLCIVRKEIQPIQLGHIVVCNSPLIHGQSFPMIHHNLDTMYGTEKL